MQDDLSEAMTRMALGQAGPSRPGISQPVTITPIATPELRNVIENMINDTLQGGEARPS